MFLDRKGGSRTVTAKRKSEAGGGGSDPEDRAPNSSAETAAGTERSGGDEIRRRGFSDDVLRATRYRSKAHSLMASMACICG
jgi:hypothetical protein